MNAFDAALKRHGFSSLDTEGLTTVQLNLGLRCNLACAHCHLEADPERTEEMDEETIQAVLDRVASRPGLLFDITGGSPELHPGFRRLVAALKEKGHEVQVRTNLAILAQPENEELPAFFKDLGVRLVASLPCYLESNVAAQRGKGVYEDAVAVIRRLNALGYGKEPALPLNLVYNPGGPFLPPSQAMLEEAYKKELFELHGIVFSRLLTITNMPLGRFLGVLEASGKARDYRALLADAFNPATVAGLMCRSQISVGWDGTLYDCDFNLALGLPVAQKSGKNVRDFAWKTLERRPIVTGDHCFGCTAGAGSSCAGALDDSGTALAG